jgi:DNA-binding CsgD family transcriptional regulator
MNVGNCVIAVIDIKSMMYVCTSPNYPEFSGWNEEDIKKGGVQYAFSRLHPNDQNGVIVFSEIINQYFKKLPDFQKGLYRAYWDFNIQNNKNEYFKVIQQDCALKYDAQGQINELLVFVFKIDNLISSDCQRLRLTNGSENLFYKYDHKLKANIQLPLLTEREMEIVKLIAKSKSMKQIGEELKISFNTVKVHSTKMMQKLQVSNSLEMVNVLRVWGFL